MTSSKVPVLPKQRYALFSAQGSLERARWWLNVDEDVAIHYASLEMRYTFEGILVNHGLASADDSKAFDKLSWQPKKLFERLRAEFAPRIDITKSYRFYLAGEDEGAKMVVGLGLQKLEPDRTLTRGYFLALPEKLFSLYGRLDANLHGTWGGRDTRLPQRPWYTEQRRFLVDFAEQLEPHTNSKNALMDLAGSKLQLKWEEVATAELDTLLRRNL